MQNREPRQFQFKVGDDVLSVAEWPGDSDPVVLLHATGFHSRCWNEVVKQLPGQHIFAIDLRFHGASSDSGEVTWEILAEDIRCFFEQMQLHQAVGVGHSIGGHLLARVAAAVPQHFKQLVLIDPVIMSPETYSTFQGVAASLSPEDHPVSRRKNRWRDANEMYERFEGRAPFSTWNRQVLRDYCEHALRPADEEGYRQLACDPVNEASIYLNQSGNEVVHSELSSIITPVTLLRAPPGEEGSTDLSTSPTWAGLASAIPRCREVFLAQMNHFIPMQDPGMVADYIKSAQKNTWHTAGIAQ